MRLLQIQADEQVTYKAPKKYSKRQQQKEKGHATSDGFVDSTMSAKILAEVKAQQDEIAAEERARARAAAAGSGMVVAGADSSDEDSDAGYDGARDDEEEKWVRMEDLDVVGASAEDEAAIRFFMSEAPQQRQSLGDMIMSQIQANVRGWALLLGVGYILTRGTWRDYRKPRRASQRRRRRTKWTRGLWKCTPKWASS